MLLDLVTIKALLGVPAANSNFDAQLTFAEEAVSQLVRDYTGRNLTRATYRERFGPSLHTSISLMEFPVERVVSFTVGSLAVPDYHLHGAKGILYFHQGCWHGPVEVEYVAGYDPIPADLRAVVLELVRRYVAMMGVDLTAAGGTAAPASAPVSSISVGQLKVSYAVAADKSGGSSGGSIFSPDAMKDFETVLDLYRNSRRLAAV